MPKISVIVPVYGGEKYLGECIESILCQTFKDFELLLLDDGSPDHSGDICDRYAQKEDRVRVIHKENEGINATRRRGVREAKGEWVMFVDDDDSLVNGALEKMTRLTEGTDIVIGFPDTPVHKKPLTLEECRSNIITAKLISPAPWAKLYRRSLLSDDIFDFPREIDGEEDMIMNIRLFFKTQRAPHILFEKVYNFRRNTASVSHTKRSSIHHEEVFDQVRAASIPQDALGKYMKEIIKSKINGLTAVAYVSPHDVCDGNNSYISKLKDDIRKCNYQCGFREWMMLHIHNPKLLQFFSFLVKVKNFLQYHLGLSN